MRNNFRIYLIVLIFLASCLMITAPFIPIANASTMTWATKTSMPTARNAAGAATVNGKIYIIGGQKISGDTNAVEEYSPTTNTWSTKANMPTPRSGWGTAAATNGKIYVIGGDGPSNLVEEYDPATDTWTTKTSMPTGRAGLRVVGATNGKVYAIGGLGQILPGDVLGIVEEYDPATDTWTTKTSMPTPRDLMGASATPDGKIFVVGGENSSGSVANVEEYNLTTDTWSIKTALPNPTEGLALVTASNNKLYAFGGFSGGYRNNSYEYNPATNAWSSVASMPTARVQLSAAVGDNGKIYVIGGYNGSFLTTNEEATIINPNQSPVINAISNSTTNEDATYSTSSSFTDTDSASWTATVDYGDGSGVNPLSLSGTSFSLSHKYKDNGSYAVIVQITDTQGATGTGTATVIVNNVAPTVGTISVIPSPAHINEPIATSANFTDLGILDTHTATWDWGDSNITTGTVTETNGSGSVSDTHTYTDFGTYTITLTVKDKDNAIVDKATTITVVKQITVLNPVQVWVSKNAGNIGVKFDFLAEAYKDNTLVSSGQLNSATAGSGGFNNATLEIIPFNSFSPIDFPQGSQLKVKVLVRNACSGSLLNNGTAKLWLNNSSANSRFGATIGVINNPYYLRNSFLLTTTVGAGPIQNINVAAGARCSAFKSFGTWTVTP